MSEATPEAGTQSDSGNPAVSESSELGEAGNHAIAVEREARKTAEKAMKGALRELQTFREQTMTEQEKAIAEAEKRGRAAAMADLGQKLVGAAFATEAARRNPEFPVQDVLDDLNLGRFLTEEGEPDTKAIQKAVERIVPMAASTPGLDLGARTPASGVPDMNARIRAAAGRS